MCPQPASPRPSVCVSVCLSWRGGSGGGGGEGRGNPIWPLGESIAPAAMSPAAAALLAHRLARLAQPPQGSASSPPGWIEGWGGGTGQLLAPLGCGSLSRSGSALQPPCPLAEASLLLLPSTQQVPIGIYWVPITAYLAPSRSPSLPPAPNRSPLVPAGPHCCQTTPTGSPSGPTGPHHCPPGTQQVPITTTSTHWVSIGTHWFPSLPTWPALSPHHLGAQSPRLVASVPAASSFP